MKKSNLTLASYKPNHKGIRKVLGTLEASIMECLWEFESATVRDVFVCLSKKRDIAYTTVMTVMGRLTDKGFLTKEKSGNAYVYSPSVSKKDLDESVAGSLLNGLVDHISAGALANFVNAISVDHKMLDELERLITAKKAEYGQDG